MNFSSIHTAKYNVNPLKLLAIVINQCLPFIIPKAESRSFSSAAGSKRPLLLAICYRQKGRRQLEFSPQLPREEVRKIWGLLRGLHWGLPREVPQNFPNNASARCRSRGLFNQNFSRFIRIRSRFIQIRDVSLRALRKSLRSERGTVLDGNRSKTW